MSLSDRELQNMAEETMILSNKMLKNGLRNQFAAAAATGFLANKNSNGDPAQTAEWAFKVADAMLAESERHANTGNQSSVDAA